MIQTNLSNPMQISNHHHTMDNLNHLTNNHNGANNPHRNTLQHNMERLTVLHRLQATRNHNNPGNRVDGSGLLWVFLGAWFCSVVSYAAYSLHLALASSPEQLGHLLMWLINTTMLSRTRDMTPLTLTWIQT